MSEILPIIETMEHRWMRAWTRRDLKELKALTSRKFRLVVASKPCMLLDARSWLDAAGTRFACTSYRFGDIYARKLGSVAVFAVLAELEARMDGTDWSGEFWITDVWHKGRVRRGWRLTERLISRPETGPYVPEAVRSLQLWR